MNTIYPCNPAPKGEQCARLIDGEVTQQQCCDVEGVSEGGLHTCSRTLRQGCATLRHRHMLQDKAQKKRLTIVNRSRRSEADSNRCRRFCRPLVKPLAHQTISNRVISPNRSANIDIISELPKHFGDFLQKSGQMGEIWGLICVGRVGRLGRLGKLMSIGKRLCAYELGISN